MTQRPVIGITCGSSRNDPRAKTEQDRLNCAYSRAVLEAGGIPVILPMLKGFNTVDYLERIDGLLLSGGADIDPALYGEMTRHDSVEVDSIRDRSEIPLAKAALERDMPVFGICRGIQTLNVALGGSLIQDLPAQRPGPIQHRQTGSRSDRTHGIDVTAGSKLAEIAGSGRFDVNSLHHQALRDVADSLYVSAFAPDGIVEGVEIPAARFVVAVQFHPEELTRESVEARRLFAAFVEASTP